MATVTERIQRGVYFRKGEAAPEFFRLVTFDFTDGIDAAGARAALEKIWDLLAELKKCRIRDLAATRPGDPEIVTPSGNLEATLCFGTKLFRPNPNRPPLTTKLPTDRPWLGARPFESLRWAATARPEASQTDFAIALHGDTELSVARAVVELQKLIDDEALPLRLVCFYSGLHRDDRRSWIDFHDGINNMASGDERRQAIEVTANAAGWLIGGTTMMFLKIEIDLLGWRKLSRELQEALVGRDKLTGCPLQSVEVGAGGALTTRSVAGCPMTGELPKGGEFVTIPVQAQDRIVQRAHVHRANLTRGDPAEMSANRIYRQGYEFVDSPPDGGVRVGLNFVSFQSDFDRVRQILDTQNWMRDANFGGIPGDAGIPAFELMRIVAGGYFLVPPVGDPFPGHDIFD